MTTILKVLGGVIGMFLFVFVLNYGLNKNEVVECNTWIKQIHENGKPPLSGWEKQQCDAHNITSNN